MTQIAGSLALITGGSRGIGAATGMALAREGATVILLARSRFGLEQVASQISKEGGKAHWYVVDLSEAESIVGISNTIKAEWGVPDILINNAGSGQWLFTEETPVGEAEEMMAVPYFAAFYLTRSFLPEMIARRSGHILNITSAAAFRAVPGATAYNAACWAVRGFSESLSADLAGTGIRVTLMVPGTTSTPGFSHYPGVEERMPKILNAIPFITPEKVAQAMMRGIERDQKVVITPWPLKLMICFNQLLPGFAEWLMIRTGWKHPNEAERNGPAAPEKPFPGR